MIHNYRLIALDLDDTLLTGDKKITEENKLWISKAMEAGVDIVFATGRGLERVEEIRKTLQLNTAMVLLNGADVWRKPGELLERYCIDKEDIVMLHDMATESGVKFWGYSGAHVYKDRDWTDKMFSMDWLKFGIHDLNEGVMNDLRARLKMHDTLEVTSSNHSNIEISQKGISKETGIRKICDIKNIPMAQVMAIGDNLNDLGLIEAAGLGIAMGNSDPRVKQAADTVTDTNLNDGVAKAIQKYIFNKEIALY